MASITVQHGAWPGGLTNAQVWASTSPCSKALNHKPTAAAGKQRSRPGNGSKQPEEHKGGLGQGNANQPLQEQSAGPPIRAKHVHMVAPVDCLVQRLVHELGHCHPVLALFRGVAIQLHLPAKDRGMPYMSLQQRPPPRDAQHQDQQSRANRPSTSHPEVHVQTLRLMLELPAAGVGGTCRSRAAQISSCSGTPPAHAPQTCKTTAATVFCTWAGGTSPAEVHKPFLICTSLFAAARHCMTALPAAACCRSTRDLPYLQMPLVGDTSHMYL